MELDIRGIDGYLKEKFLLLLSVKDHTRVLIEDIREICVIDSMQLKVLKYWQTYRNNLNLKEYDELSM